MKRWLASHGPLRMCLGVYADFLSYETEAPHHVRRAPQSGHCVCAAGDDVPRRSWICKNGWNASRGRAGFFNIASGQVGIGAAMWPLGV
jgi:hypothetical protein